MEKEPVPGGLAAGFQPAPELPVGGPYLEKFYHHLFRSDTAVTALIEELGLAPRLVWPTPVNAVLYGGRIWRPYTPLGLLRFTPLPWLDRVRMGLATAYLKLVRDERRLAPYTAREWLLIWMGRRAYEICWEPLLRAKFGERFAEIAMPWFWARIHYRSFALGYLRGGFQAMYDALVAEIRRLGSEVVLGHEVTGLCYQPGRAGEGAWVITSRPVGTPPDPARPSLEAEQRRFDRVVSTLPIRLTCRLIPDLPEPFRQRYDWGEALGAHCLILALDRPFLPRGEYWLNVNDPGYPFLVLVEHTNYMPAQDYGGRRLVYLGNYLPMSHRIFQLSKEEILAEFLPALQRINPAFDATWVTESWSFGAAYAQPIVTREYPQHIPPLKGPLPGLWIGSMFQVYPQD
ncbi:MAG: FAD-dependent oxidoreductase, partial [Chloroflexota bacterium]